MVGGWDRSSGPLCTMPHGGRAAQGGRDYDAVDGDPWLGAEGWAASRISSKHCATQRRQDLRPHSQPRNRVAHRESCFWAVPGAVPGAGPPHPEAASLPLQNGGGGREHPGPSGPPVLTLIDSEPLLPAKERNISFNLF